MGFCLPKFAAEEFKAKLIDGTINPDKLTGMTSAERREFFGDIVGERDARQVNALFESKLLLKNQQAGMVTWAKQLTGIKPEVRRDLLSRVERLGEVLQPKELDAFLEDLASTRLGLGVTAEEAGRITELARDIELAKENSDRFVYGRASVAFTNYVEGLKAAAEGRTPIEIAKDVYRHPLKSTIQLGGQTKAIKASLDNSAIFRQGWKTMFTHPGTWLKNSAQSFADIAHTFQGREVMDEVKADIVSRPTYDLMKKAKLAVGQVEEAYPTSLPEKIPFLGRVYKASENAYTGFVYRMRADVFDKYIEIAKQTGVDVTDKQELEGIGSLVNSLTGRASIGRFESAADVVNNVFFSPRLVKSHIDVLTAHRFDPNMSDFAKKQAAINLAKIVGGTAVIFGIANALSPGSVELDPRSADFGKIKVGDSRFDVSGGMASVITLAARLLTMSSKSSVTGTVNLLNSNKFGATNGLDVIVDFLANKASPIAGVFRDFLKGQDPNGNKPTLVNEGINLVAPLPITNFFELKDDPDSAGPLAGMIADGLGIAVNSYGNTPASMVANDKPKVVQEVLEKMAAGDRDGATALAHDFNAKLRENIKTDLTKKDALTDPEKLDQTVDKQWKKDAIYLPTDLEVENFKNGATDVVAKVAANGRPVIVKDSPIPTQGVVGTIVTYAQAIGTDPVTAFNDIFKGQSIRQVTNGTVIVNRMALSQSQKVKSDRGGNNPTMKLDHTLPLELGGNNEESNLKLVPTAVWASYTPVEDYLGKKLKARGISKEEAQKAITDFKSGTVTFGEIKAKYGN